MIQIIGRALRLHKDKIYANIILPFSSKEDETSIINFMKVMAKNDSRIKKSLESKKLGGYISLIKNDDDDENEELRDINFKYELIFDSMGKIKNSEEIFIKRLEEVKTYIDENGRRPSGDSKDKNIKSMGVWIGNSQKNYSKKIYNMKNETIYKLWEEFVNNTRYKEYFLSPYNIFVYKLNKVKIYIDTNKKKPSTCNKDSKSIGIWVGHSQNNYSKKIHNMKDETIYNLWTEFINDARYKEYIQLPSMLEKFVLDINKLKTYIDKHKKRPSVSSKDKYIKSMGIWLSNSLKNYAKKIKNMKDETIYKLWEEFFNDEKYKKYIKLPAMLELFNNNLNELKLYIDTHNQRPLVCSKDKDIKSIAHWMHKCQTNYSKKIQNMKDETIYKLWTEFINNSRYKKYMQIPTMLEKFILDFNKLKIYIDTNKQRPSVGSKDKDIKSMAKWIGHSQNNYSKKIHNMKNETIYNLWTEFINNDKYKEYFK